MQNPCSSVFIGGPIISSVGETFGRASARGYWPPMNTDEHGFPDSLTGSVLGAVFEVSNTLGAGFLEKVYERALLLELRLRGIRAVGQVNQVSALPSNGCAPVPPTLFAWRPVVSCETPKSPPARLTHSLCCIG